MTILRVEVLSYGVEKDKLAEGVRFYEDFGLGVVERGDNGAVFRTRENQRVVVRASDDPRLPAAAEFIPDSSVRETVWGVDTQAALDEIEAELAKDTELTKDNDGTIHCFDPCGYAIGFTVAAVEEIGVDAPATNFQDAYPRLNRRVVDNADDAALDQGVQIHPLRIGHVVFGTPEGTRDAGVKYYTERLNFKLTDIVNGMGDFMRCDGSTYHHVLFLTHGRVPGFNHVAFEVKDFDEIIQGGKYLRDQEWDTSRNPGRHNLGSNLHWYFKNPCGGESEYFADMDRMDDSWETRVWEKPPVINIWKTEVA